MLSLVSPAQAQTAEAIRAAQQAGDSLLGMGPFGAMLVLLLLGAAIVVTVLWRDNLRLRNRIDADQDARETRDEARFIEVKLLAEVVSTALAKSAAAELAMGASLEHTNDLVETQGALIEARTANFNELKASSGLLHQALQSLKESVDTAVRRLDR